MENPSLIEICTGAVELRIVTAELAVVTPAIVRVQVTVDSTRVISEGRIMLSNEF